MFDRAVRLAKKVWDTLYPPCVPVQPDWQGMRGGCRDYVMLMLGAPVVKIELDESQLNFCIDEGESLMRQGRPVESRKAKVFLEGLALAHAKIILGRIRTKYGNPPGGGVRMDGKLMLDEGLTELDNLKAKLRL